MHCGLTSPSSYMYKYTLQVSIKFYDSLASHSCIYDLVCYIKKNENANHA